MTLHVSVWGGEAHFDSNDNTLLEKASSKSESIRMGAAV